MTPADLPPRQRELVYLLWSGLSPKQAASAMHISMVTVRHYTSEIGARLGGTCSPVQRIMLWQTEVLRADPTFLQLSPSPPVPTLTTHAATPPESIEVPVRP